MITSLKNDRVRLVQALQNRRRIRQRERSFVIEGVRLCEEAARADVLPHFVFYTPDAKDNPRALALLETWEEAGVDSLQVSQPVMEACSDTETPQGVLAVVSMPALPPPAQPTMTLILDRLRDPGNLGTILRTALAAGVSQVLIAPGTVDATNPKVVRAGMGAHFRLPVATTDWQGISEAVEGQQVYLASAAGETLYTDVDWLQPAALVIGGEARGASKRAHMFSSAEIAIPLCGDVESLNAAMATAVILFEAMRQRRIR